MKLKTVGDVVELIRKNAQSGLPDLAEHAKTLLGPRLRGSTTAVGIEMVDAEITLHEVHNPNVGEGCVCYMFYWPYCDGRLGAISLEDAWHLGLKVEVREGLHGPELYVDRPQEKCLRENRVYVIVGKHQGVDAVFTWHPGEPLGSLSDGLTKDTAVKLHNGGAA